MTRIPAPLIAIPAIGFLRSSSSFFAHSVACGSSRASTVTCMKSLNLMTSALPGSRGRHSPTGSLPRFTLGDRRGHLLWRLRQGGLNRLRRVCLLRDLVDRDRDEPFRRLVVGTRVDEAWW